MKMATQQAQECALRLETELSTAQDRIGAAERKAAQAERRQWSLQKRMDDWDAFDPDLHAALNASLTPPVAGDMQPAETTLPTGSEETIQSAHQVQTAIVLGPLAQQGYVIAATIRQSAPQVQLSYLGWSFN